MIIGLIWLGLAWLARIMPFAFSSEFILNIQGFAYIVAVQLTAETPRLRLSGSTGLPCTDEIVLLILSLSNDHSHDRRGSYRMSIKTMWMLYFVLLFLFVHCTL